MYKLQVTLEFEVDPRMWGLADKEEHDSFVNDVLGGPLILHSNYIGDAVNDTDVKLISHKWLDKAPV